MTPATAELGELRALEALALHAAREAGAVLLAHHGRQLDVDTKTSATDPVSAADREAEATLAALLRVARPDDGLLGEEGAAAEGRSGYRWVLDPLDGTVNYLYGHVGWAVSVACEEHGPDGWEAVVGVVHDPVHDETFRAVLGGGAWLLTGDGDGSGAVARPPASGEVHAGDHALRVNDPVRLEQALIATGFAYDREHRARQGPIAARVLAAARDLRRVGSAALDLCAVAAGRVDGYWEDTPARWDWAAGALIAREAGALVTPLPGPNPEPGVIAAGPALHQALAALVLPR